MRRVPPRVERHQAGAGDRVGGRPVALAQADLGPDERGRAGQDHRRDAEDRREEPVLVAQLGEEQRGDHERDATDPGGAADAQHALPVERRGRWRRRFDGRRRRRRDRRARRHGRPIAGAAGRRWRRPRHARRRAGGGRQRRRRRLDGRRRAATGAGHRGRRQRRRAATPARAGATEPGRRAGAPAAATRRRSGRRGGAARRAAGRGDRRGGGAGCGAPRPGWTPGRAPAPPLHPRLGPGEPLDPGIERPDGVLERRHGFAELPGSQEADQRDDRRHEEEEPQQGGDQRRRGVRTLPCVVCRSSRDGLPGPGWRLIRATPPIGQNASTAQLGWGEGRTLFLIFRFGVPILRVALFRAGRFFDVNQDAGRTGLRGHGDRGGGVRRLLTHAQPRRRRQHRRGRGAGHAAGAGRR